MKKIFTIMVFALAAVLVLAHAGVVLASVSGQCSNCHTMHDSQGAAAMATGGPNEALLMNSCIGCHTTSGGDPLDDTLGTPYVKGSGFTNDKCIAGGFFTDGGGSHDDNSHTLGSTESPAGYNGTFYQGAAGAGKSFSCAGATGCHGNETSINDDTSAIKGGHHDTSSAYRMLYVGGSAVAGTGTADYEEALIAGATTDTTTSGLAHNIYSAGASDVTISELCGKCHGAFHSVTGAPSPFTRHPTDVDVPTTWDIVDGTTGKPHATNYTDADRKYNPLGFAGGASEDNVGRVTCVSCHRAHGSAEDDILRFTYSDQSAAGGNDWGCLGCHSNQQ